MVVGVCTGCSLLCEDIDLTLEGGVISRSKNLCRKGQAHFKSPFVERASTRIDGQDASPDKAIKMAAELLRDSKRPLLFGWSNSSLEAQRAGIDLAQELGATLDDTSSFCEGLLLERVLLGKLPTCTLDDVRNLADISLFWGADPANSHPRHLSRFSYYPRGDKRQKGYEEEREAIAVDVRKSSTAKLCKEYFRVVPGGDADFIAALIAVLEGKIPRIEDKKRMIELGSMLRKAEFGAVFPGLGLVYSLKEKIEMLDMLLHKLNELCPYKVIPMIDHYNTRGFNQLLLDETGFIDQISFHDGEVRHGPECSIVSAAKTCDAALVIGSDPLSALPLGIARSLAKVPMIVVDPCRSLTADQAKVVLASAMYGLNAGGSALRMDGVKIRFEPLMSSDLLSDEEILTRIKEEI